MTTSNVAAIIIFFLLILAVTKPLGSYMADVFEGRRTFLHPILGWFEKLVYKVTGIDPEEDQKWTTYAFAMLVFSAAGLLLTYGLLRLQGYFPWNPQHFGAKEMTADLALNTSVSFTTNTNWQAYTPETTVSYFSNMVSLAIHNWMSAATGIAIAVAVIRGFSRKPPASSGGTGNGSANGGLSNGGRSTVSSFVGIGNFWVDLTRATLYVLFPICLIAGTVMVAAGVPQTLASYANVTGLEGAKQTIALGMVASQEVIKMLGTNGGGIFNANSAHPFENPSNFTNLLQIFLIFSIPAGLTYTFGKMVGNTKQGWAVFAAMAIMFLGGAFVCNTCEQAGTPQLAQAGVQTLSMQGQPGGNMEGKETRFGIGASATFATVTTDASCGAINSWHDSYTPIGGFVPLFNLLTGEVIFGGVGAGLYGMLMFCVITVFIAGLMVGRTPEYIGKKIQKFEVQMAMLACLILAANILGWTALSANMHYPPGDTAQTFTKDQAADEAKLPTLAMMNHVGNSDPSNYEGNTVNNTNNSGAHGFSEIFYMYASEVGNNGSAFAGITGNTPHYNITGALAMFMGRFFMILPLLAMAGSLAMKKAVPMSAGTFPTDSTTFVLLLIGVVIIVNALTFFPALSLGPIVEQLQMHAGKTF